MVSSCEQLVTLSLLCAIASTAGCTRPSDSTTRTPQAKATPPPQSSASVPPPPLSPVPVPVHKRMSTGAHKFSVSIGECELFWTIEGPRAWWRVESQDQDATSCYVLADRLRPGWIALAERARSQKDLSRTLGLGVAFFADEPSVEKWFRYQVASRELQTILRRTNDAPKGRMLASRLTESGALSRYESLLKAMGFVIDDVSLSKISVQRSSKWASEFPNIEQWDLPAMSKLALPYITRLTIREFP